MGEWTKEPWENRYARQHVTAANWKAYMPLLAECHGRDCHANGDRIVTCVNAMQGIPDPAAFVAAAKAVVLNGRGRSGGSVYMVNKAEWLAFKQALDAKEAK